MKTSDMSQMNDCEKLKREMTFEEEATLYEREARDMFSKEEVMRIIRKSGETIASLQKIRRPYRNVINV